MRQMRIPGNLCRRAFRQMSGIGGMMLLAFGLHAQIQHCATKPPENYRPAYLEEMTIPREPVALSVVVHVLYFEPEENISDAQIHSQIEELNRAFGESREALDHIPPEFRELVAEVGFSFCLATEDPQGNPTTGITRTFVSQPDMGQTDAIYYSALGGVDNWDPERYINIRVVRLGEEILGKATFPGEGPAEEDGLVISPYVFGFTGIALEAYPYHLGRTTVHEMGHYFGLLHPWGQATEPLSCENDDGLEDTPQTAKTYLERCPQTSVWSCGTSDMYTNYMSYTNDACLWQFTPMQKNVMWHTLLTQRSGLLSGNACASSLPEVSNPEDLLFSVFPNPFSGQLTLSAFAQTKSALQVELYDFQGRFLERYFFPAGADMLLLNLHDLPPGLYLLCVRTEEGARLFLQRVICGSK